MTDLLVRRRLYGDVQAMSFREFFKAFPYREVPDASAAATAAVALEAPIVFLDRYGEPTAVLIDHARYREMPWRDLRNVAVDLTAVRNSMLAPPPPTPPVLLLTGPKTEEKEEPLWRVEVATTITHCGHVYIHAPDAAAAQAMFENNPARWADEAREIADNTFDWADHDARSWRVLEVEPHDEE